MADIMSFQDDWHDFLAYYSFKDRQEYYTNGSILIPTFRVEQMIEHYFERTCTIDYADSGNGQCSACKEFVSIYDGWASFGDDVYTNNYCPFCGAKVTNNE